MSPIAHVLELLGPRALQWKQVQAWGDWALRFPNDRAIVFGLVQSGECGFSMDGVTPRRLQAGDFLLIPAPRSWLLGSGVITPPIDFEALDPARNTHLIEVGSPSSDTSTRLLCGRFASDDVNADFITSLMPPLIHIKSDDKVSARMRGLLALIDEEAWSDGRDQALVLGRLLEVLLVLAFRDSWTQTDQGPQPGLLNGLADPKIAAALHALHKDMSRNWRVADLAALAGMSRSAFAERFTRVVGIGPIEYLSKVADGGGEKPTSLG